MARLEITPINPFTKRQAQFIEMHANGMSYQDIADDLGISRITVKNTISGSCDMGKHTKSGLGVFGIIEEATGKRPNKKTWIPPLVGDVLFENIPHHFEEPKPEKQPEPRNKGLFKCVTQEKHYRQFTKDRRRVKAMQRLGVDVPEKLTQRLLDNDIWLTDHLDWWRSNYGYEKET